MSKRLASGLILWLLALTVSVGPAWARGGLADGAGVVQSLDFGEHTLVIDGMRYQVADDVDVEINGSYGAFTMLEEGMRVYYEFLRISPSERVVTLIRELPDNVEIPGV